MHKSRTNIALWVLTLIAGGLSLGGCEDVFTYSPLEGLQRDPSKLPAEQQAVLAEDAINSGDTEAMSDLYEKLKTTEDPQVMPVAADLAMAISGVPSALTEIAGQAATVDFADADSAASFQESAEKTIESVDTGKVAEAVALIEGAESSGATVTSDQYAMAAVGLAVKVAKDVGDVEAIMSESSGPTLTAEQQADLTKAESFLSKSEYNLEDLGFAF